MSLRLDVLKECLDSAHARVEAEVTDSILAELISMETAGQRIENRYPPDSDMWAQVKAIAYAYHRAKNIEAQR